jgi:hypothetical protein
VLIKSALLNAINDVRTLPRNFVASRAKKSHRIESIMRRQVRLFRFACPRRADQAGFTPGFSVGQNL